MNYILFDDTHRSAFLPLTFNRPVADLFMGCFSNRNRWEHILNGKTSSFTEEYLQDGFPMESNDRGILINGRWIPDSDSLKEVQRLKEGEKLIYQEDVIAAYPSKEEMKKLSDYTKEKSGSSRFKALNKLELTPVKAQFHAKLLSHVWELFQENETILKSDAKLLELENFKHKEDKGNRFLGDDIHIHPSAKVNASILNSENGPIIIDEGAEVMEGSMIRGPFYLGKKSVVKMGAKIYGATSIGNQSKVGGEINNCIVFSYSNKAHDGFIGNSVIGEWCNLGADTNTSNLKNDYSEVKLWNYEQEGFQKTGQQFLGLIMGDHSKCGINTMFNTGTVVGVSCNIFGAGYLPNHVPSFSWGKAGSFMTYLPDKAMKVASIVMKRRDIKLQLTEEHILRAIFKMTEAQRSRFN